MKRCFWLCLLLVAFSLQAQTLSVSLGQLNVGPQTNLGETHYNVSATWTAGYSLPYLTTAGWFHYKDSPGGSWILGGTFNSGASGLNPKTGVFNYSWLKTNYAAIRFHIRVLDQYSQPVEQQSLELEFLPFEPVPKKVHLGLTNPSLTHPMEYRIYQDGNLIDTVTVPGGQSVAAVIEVPGNSEITVFARVKDVVQNDMGQWFESPDSVTDLGPVTAQGGGAISPIETNGTPPKTDIKPPENVPSNGTPKDTDKPIWNPTTAATLDSERLDKATYREGVDKIVAELKRTIPTENVDPPSAADASALEGKPEASQVTGILAKIPPMLSVTAPDTVTSFSVTFDIPEVGDKTMTVDLTKYATGISVFRAICSAVLALLFWWAVVVTVRGAFAG